MSYRNKHIYLIKKRCMPGMDIVWLSQSKFRTYSEKTNFLSCVIGHELSHIIYNDHIE